MPEALQAFSAELGEAALCLFRSLLTVEMRLGVELVGIAYQLLFKRFGQKVMMRQRQVMRHYLTLRQSGTGMTLANTGMTRQSFTAKHLRPNHTMTYVRLCAVAFYAWSIGTYDADIVEHGSLFKKLPVEPQFRMSVGYTKSLASHRT